MHECKKNNEVDNKGFGEKKRKREMRLCWEEIMKGAKELPLDSIAHCSHELTEVVIA